MQYIVIDNKIGLLIAVAKEYIALGGKRDISKYLNHEI